MRQVFLLFCLPLVMWHIVSYSQTNAKYLNNSPETRKIDGKDAWKVYKLKNSQVILSLHQSSLFLSKDGGVHWQNLTFSNQFHVRNVYISERDYIYVIAQGWAGDHLVSFLYESRDKGESWKVLRQFQQHFGCGIQRVDSLMVTDSRVYCDRADYTSKYDSLDQIHRVQLNGKTANVSFKNEMEAAAFTSDGVYLSKDGGVNWTFKGAFYKSNLPYPLALDTRQQYSEKDKQRALLWSNESLHYISDDRIIYITNMTIGNKYLVQGLLYNNGVFSPYFEQKPEGSINLYGNINFFPKDDLTYLLTSATDIFKSIDGGITWNKLNLPAAYGDHYKFFTDIKVDELKNLYFVSGVSHGSKDSTSWLFVTTGLIV